MSLCSPALLYFIIGLISIISMVYSKTDIQTVSIQALFIALWTWFLNFLCSKGHEGISWFLVIIPFVVMALVIISASNIIGAKLAENKEMFKDDVVDCRNIHNEDKTYCFCKKPENKNNIRCQHS